MNGIIWGQIKRNSWLSRRVKGFLRRLLSGGLYLERGLTEVCTTPTAFATRFDATSRALFPQLIERGRGRQRYGSSTVFFPSTATMIVLSFRVLTPSSIGSRM